MSDDKSNLSDGLRTALIFKALVRCEVVRDLTESFHRATGLTLELLPPQSLQCFKHASQAALPIVVGGQPTAILVAGQMRFRRRVPQDRFAGCVRLMGVLARLIGEGAGRWILANDGSEPIAVQRAKEFIQASPSITVKLRDVAQHVHFSPQHLSKQFKKATGIPFSEYASRVRVERAKELLHNRSVSVKQAMYESGFQSISTFYRVFRRFAGVTPRQYQVKM